MFEEQNPESVLKHIFRVAQLLTYTNSSQSNNPHSKTPNEHTAPCNIIMVDESLQNTKKTAEFSDEVK